MLEINKKMSKVFCIGMFKTGTTSMGKAFEILGLKTLNGPWWPKGLMINDPYYERADEWCLYHNNIKKIINLYDAFQDYPWMFLYKEISEWFPDSKFILTMRNPNDLASSDINMLKRLGHPENSIPSEKKLINRYVSHKDEVLKYFSKKKNFIEFDLFKGDGWKKLCDFLNFDIPNEDFPHLNKKKIK